jgi:hypothetical protein
LNLRPSGYEPDELPGCSTPRPQGEALAPHPDKVRRLRLILTSTNRVAVCRSAGATAKRLLPYDVSVVMPEPIAAQLVSCRGRTDLDPVRQFSFCIFGCWSKAKGRLRGPMISAGPKSVMRRSFVTHAAFEAFRLRRMRFVAFGRPGSDRLSRVLRRSTIGAGAFHGRVRNGNGCSRPAMTTRSAKRNKMRSWFTK